MRPLADCRLYTFVDTACLGGRDPANLARQLCEGGSDLVQLRAKGRPLEEVRGMARTLLPITESFGVRLVINDHPLLAAEIGAPFFHLGQEDLFDGGHSPLAPRPSNLHWGLSTHSPDQARRALQAGPDYIAIGPVFATPTKPGRAPVTVEYVRWAAAQVPIPWFAIGGITLDNLDAVLAAGATRVCVVRAILHAPDPAEACRAFKARLPSAARNS